MTPFKINDILMEPGNNLKLHMKNVEIFGVENIQITKAKIDLDNMKIKSELTMPRAEIIGDYDVTGRILVLPINGKGPANMTLVNINFEYTMTYAKEEVNGYDQVVFKDHELEYTPERVYYDLGNLFNGDKRLGDEMLKFLNENWKEIDRELSGAFKETLKALTKSILDNSVKDVPYEEVIKP